MCLRVLVNPVSGKATNPPVLYFDDEDPDTDIMDVECDYHGPTVSSMHRSCGAQTKIRVVGGSCADSPV